ncbi:hypothetical protein F4604DRAFT_1796706 [Suillus subluteus]|nr:hypothetical protein F4604DRAFT_1796706 [Suillus subluteus]
MYSGWVVGPNDRLLFWVPLASRNTFYYNPAITLVIPRGGPELDLSRMAHGPHWQKCREDCACAVDCVEVMHSIGHRCCGHLCRWSFKSGTFKVS